MGAAVEWGSLQTHLADTLVVKLAHSLAYTSLVVPVISSHWAWSVPPVRAGETGLGGLPNQQALVCCSSSWGAWGPLLSQKKGQGSLLAGRAGEELPG